MPGIEDVGASVQAHEFICNPHWWIAWDERYLVYFGCGPLTVTVTTRIVTFLVGDPYKPSFPTVTGRGPHPRYIYRSMNG